MANIFASGEELLNKKDFDEKVNINQPMFKKIDNANTWSDILSDPKSANTLMSIRDNTNGGLPATDGNVVGGNGAVDNIKWHEDLDFKSDIARLEQEISDLKKQIGGVLSRLLTHLNNRLVRKVAV